MTNDVLGYLWWQQLMHASCHMLLYTRYIMTWSTIVSWRSLALDRWQGTASDSSDPPCVNSSSIIIILLQFVSVVKLDAYLFV